MDRNSFFTGFAKGMLWLGGPLALGLVFSSAIISKAIENSKEPRRTVSVKGFAEKKIISDAALWNCQISARSPVITDAYAKIRKDLALVISGLEACGIKKDEIEVLQVSIENIFKTDAKGRSTGEVENFILRQELNVKTPEVAKIKNIGGEMSKLIEKGVEINSQPPQYFYTKLDELKIELLGKAALDARGRAEQLASSNKASVGPLQKVNQGVFQITPALSTDTSNSGCYDTSTIEKSIKSVITAKYYIIEKDTNSEKK